MTDSAKEEWLSRIASTGLTISSDPAPSDVPPVREAMLSVSNWEVEPTSTVPLDHANALQEVDQNWHAHAARNGLFGNDGSFLLSVSGAGSRKFGWAMVKWSPGAELAPRLARAEEGLDFVAMSVDGRVVCAVTEEEYEYWIVVQHLR
ncbi:MULTISPECIES: hypothetical protein [unclassified Streptomyces]|uniref:hypothetical protein n=1 Tax=unclassified Streptomyces TaxID=2593676 RepID=UPI003807835C